MNMYKKEQVTENQKLYNKKFNGRHQSEWQVPEQPKNYQE